MSRSKQFHDALGRLAAAEERFLQGEFLAPVLRGAGVRVRVAGVVCRLRVEPADFEGWGVFRPASHSEARLVRPAGLAERQRYLGLFPLVRLVLAGRAGPEWLALPAHRADHRFRVTGLVPVRLVEEGQLFEVVRARCDGAQFWYEGPEPRWDAAAGAYLRQNLERMTDPDQLDRPGLTAEERTAYAVHYLERARAAEEARRDHNEERLRQALAHAGAELKEFVERTDVYTVRYEVDGQEHVSVVSRADLTVQTAGICLSGRDDDFDLQSLVGVLREAQGGLVRQE
jgi:hypothetical protein